MSLCMYIMFVRKGKPAGQRARCRPVCLCKYVRLSDEVQHRMSAASYYNGVCMCVCIHGCVFCVCTGLWCYCTLFGFGWVCVWLYVLGKKLQEFKQAPQTCRTHTHTQIQSLFLALSLSPRLGYFISARWPVSRANIEVMLSSQVIHTQALHLNT